MFAYLKTASAALLGLGLVAAVTPAKADRSGDIAAGIIGGAIVGGIIGNATAGAAPRPVYVERERPVYRSGCRDLRERAQYLEDTGRFERARHAWREYRACRGE